MPQRHQTEDVNQSPNQLSNQKRPISPGKPDQGNERDQNGRLKPKDKKRAQVKRASTWDSE
jgi:hypothetical protein